MATHRSLNKLEFKAHMSIHNTQEVTETETHEARNGTRDRFGKSHVLSNEDGSTRLPRRLKALFLVLFFGAMFQAGVFAEETVAPRRNTDIQVATDGLDANSWLDKKLNKPEDSFGIPLSDSTMIGFNDDGDPSVGMRY